MKKISRIASLVLLAALHLVVATGCHGDVNELERPVDGDNGNQPSTNKGLVLSVDKQSIEANGIDCVNFSLKLDGVELMNDDETLQSVYIKHEKSGQRLDKWSTSWTAVKNGDYSFVATYKGKQSTNAVQVKVRNREKYEPYGQKVLVYDLTGTWCHACPSMAAALENVSEEWQPNMIVLGVHTNGGGYNDPYAIGTQAQDLGSMLLDQFRGEGYPDCVYDLAYRNSERTASGIGTIIREHLRDYPATCGVKIASSNIEGSTLTVEATLHSPKGGEYELGYAVLLDNQRYTQGTEPDGIYDDIVCAVSSNFNGQSEGSVILGADGTHSQTFTIEDFPYGDKKSDLRIVIFALAKSGDKFMVDNANVCPVGESIDYTPVDFYDGIPENSGNEDVVPEGVVRISADKTTIKADGSDTVTFKVVYGSEDISTAGTMYIVRTFNGEEIELPRGTNTFTTTTAGTYKFKARYYKGGNIYSDNEISILATNASSSGSQQFRHRMLGMQFTSVGCTNCPTLSNIIKTIQNEQPNRLVPVSFHLDYQISDPMHIAIADRYYNELKGNGLPSFFIDMRDGEEMNSNKSVIDSEMAKILANYPPSCGIAISTSYDSTSRELTILPRLMSNTATAYRYLVLLVEDGIEASQYGTSGTYIHNNVVRQVLSDNIYGTRFNGGVALVAGEDTPLSSAITVTLSRDWNPAKMRVVVAALNSSDGGATYTCNNTTQCVVGGSVEYEFENGGSTPDDGGDGGDTPTEVRSFNRHVAVFEFTGTTCSFCPGGYTYLKYLIEDYFSEETVHIMAFHDTKDDPMGTPLTYEIYNAFKLGVFPSFIVDMRDAYGNDDKSNLRDAINRSFEQHPATCGLALTSSCDANGNGSVDVKLCASSEGSYRVALYIVEDGIVAPQLNGFGQMENDYTHNHVVRTLLSKIYEGDSVGTLAAGEESIKNYTFTLGSECKAANCSIYALAIDNNGYVNNVAICPLNGTAPYDYAE